MTTTPPGLLDVGIVSPVGRLTNNGES